MNKSATYHKGCQECPRLASFLQELRSTYPAYFNAPVPSFGAKDARLLIVGLAPGMHGANATGRPFTGDFAGEMLYETLHRYGFSSAPVSRHKDDDLVLKRCRITNAVKCLPPQNKPVGREIATCNHYLAAELEAMPNSSVVLALGTIAHNAVLRAFKLTLSHFKFGHGSEHALPGERILVDSYHCSRYNTNTGRLTQTMFDEVFEKLTVILNASEMTLNGS